MELLTMFFAVGVVGFGILGLLIPIFKLIDYGVDKDWSGAKLLTVCVLYGWVYLSLAFYGWEYLKKAHGC